jgi:hypothetical protein
MGATSGGHPRAEGEIAHGLHILTSFGRWTGKNRKGWGEVIFHNHRRLMRDQSQTASTSDGRGRRTEVPNTTPKVIAERPEWFEDMIETISEWTHSQIPPSELTRFDQFLSVLRGQEEPSVRNPQQIIHPRLWFPGLTARPWHDPSTVAEIEALESHYAFIRAEYEGLTCSGGAFKPYTEVSRLVNGGRKPGSDLDLAHPKATNEEAWGAYHLWQTTGEVVDHCRRCPVTAGLLRAVSVARESLFSRLAPLTDISVHSDQLNFVLTCHLGVVIPRGCQLVVGEEARTWHEGEALLFDSSFLHAAMNDSHYARTVLLLDVWHPELRPAEVSALRSTLQIINQHTHAGAELPVL